jgi:purine-binding chemotaxis protein CheW
MTRSQSLDIISSNKRHSIPAVNEDEQYLIFSLAREAFAVRIAYIKEIIEYDTLTEVPMMPACVRGVINLRGSVVPIIDLGARFKQGQTQVGRRTCIVIIDLGPAEGRNDVGILVDGVNEVLEIPSGDIEPPPAFGARMRSDFIEGLARRAGDFVIVLRVERLLALDDLAGGEADECLSQSHGHATPIGALEAPSRE